jgi:peptidoglycan-N-acetylglucosamine deacetylase
VDVNSTVTHQGVKRRPLPAARGERVVALTFDDGPGAYTGDVMRVLQKKRVTGTFFVVGQEIRGREGLLSAMDRSGYEIGNHTWSHPDLTALSPGAVQRELGRLNGVIRGLVGHQPLVFRPPYRAVDARIRALARDLGLETVLWNVDPQDWARPGCRILYRRVTSEIPTRATLLLHDGGRARDQTVCALSKIIRKLKSWDYRFVTVSAMLQEAPDPSLPPAQPRRSS